MLKRSRNLQIVQMIKAHEIHTGFSNQKTEDNSAISGFRHKSS